MPDLHHLQFELRLEQLSSRRADREVLLWLIAAAPADARKIVHQFDVAESACRDAFFVCEDDGSPPIGVDDVVGVRCGSNLCVFASPSAFERSNAQEITDRVRCALGPNGSARALSPRAVDLLFIRLWGNGAQVGFGSGASGVLGRSLSALQTSDVRRSPHVSGRLANDMLIRLPKGSSRALKGLLQKLEATAMVNGVNNDLNVESGMIQRVRRAFEYAAEDFRQAGLLRQAEQCERRADLVDIISEACTKTQLLLPGIPAIGRETVPIPNASFRSYRALGVPVTLNGAGIGVGSAIDRAMQKVERSSWTKLGEINLANLDLERLLRDVSYGGLAPRLEVVAGDDDGSTLRIWLEEEHRVFLGAGGGSTQPGSAQGNYVVGIEAGGKPCKPVFRAIKPGGAGDFRAGGRIFPREVVVTVSNGDSMGSFRLDVG